MDRFEECGMPVSSLLLPLEALNDKHFKARNTLIEIDDAKVGDIRSQGLDKFKQNSGISKEIFPAVGGRYGGCTEIGWNF